MNKRSLSIHKRNIRFKNKIIKSEKNKILGVAIDTSKTFHRVLVFNFLGKMMVKPFSISTLRSGYEELKRQIEIAKKKNHSKQLYIALETPAKYTQNLVEHLRKDYKRVMFVPPIDVAQNRNQRTFRGLKTDDIDAGSVGDLLIRGEFIEPKKEKCIYLRLRNLVYWREQKLIMGAMIKNQLNHRFERIFPGANSNYEGLKPLFSQPYRSFLHEGLLKADKTAREVLNVPNEVLLKQFGYGNLPHGPYFIRSLKNKLNEILLPDEKKTKIELELLKKDGKLLEIFDSAIREVEGEIITLGSQTPAKYLFDQIKGVNNLAASLYVGVIGDVRKYKSAGHIYSYAGLNPRRRQSGNTNLESIGIKRMGNTLLRCLLFRMANQVVVCNPNFNRYFKRLRKEKNKTWKEALIIICHKLNNIFYALMRDKVPYQEKPLEIRHEI